MPQISRNSHSVKDIVCDLAKDLLTSKVGDKIEFQLKDEKMVLRGYNDRRKHSQDINKH